MVRSVTNTGRAILAASTAVAALAIAGSAHAQAAGDILLGDRIHSESIAAIPGGGLLVGSLGQGAVYRVAPGATTAEQWVSVRDEMEGGLVAGVFATDDTAWVCVSGPFGSNISTLMSFDLATAEKTGSYPFPMGGFCNDIAVGPDGTVFVANSSFTPGGTGYLMSLVPNDAGELGFRIDLAGAAFGGIDGLAFVDGILYANNVSANELYRIDMDANGVSGVTTLNLSIPLGGPDGMRTTADGTGILIAENTANRITRVTIDGNDATVTVVADGLVAPTAIAELDGTIYYVEPNFAALFDPTIVVEPFYAKAIPAGM